MSGEHSCRSYCITTGLPRCFTASPSPSPKALANEDSYDGADEEEEDEDASSFSDKEMTTSQ